MSTIREDLNLEASKVVKTLIMEAGEPVYLSCDDLYKKIRPICHFTSKRDMGITLKALGYKCRIIRLENIATRCYFLK